MFYKFTLLAVTCPLYPFGFKTSNFPQPRDRDIPGHILDIYPQSEKNELPIYKLI